MIILSYLGKMVLCSGILLGYYWLFLRNRRFHHYNRFYLLATLVFSIVLPFIKIPVFEDPGMLNQVAYNTARIVTLPSVTQAESLQEGPLQTSTLLTPSNLLWLLYGAGLLVLLFILVRGLLYIRKISRRYNYEVVEKLRFYQTREPGSPFSFFRSIFWNDQLNFNSAQGQQIFRHELFHVQQKHTADILLAELITMIGWFNPFFHLIKKELKAIHEFLADQYAASGSNQYQYAELLVQQVMTHRQQSLAHHFFQNQLKRRIAMITQLNQSKYGYWSRVMVLPVSLLLFFSVTLYAGQQKEVPAGPINSFVFENEEQYTDRTDTIPPTDEKAILEAKIKILSNALILEKKVQEQAPRKNDKFQKSLELNLQLLKYELELTEKNKLSEDQLYHNKDTVYRGKDIVYRGKDAVYHGKDAVYSGKDEVYRGKDSVFYSEEQLYTSKEKLYYNEEKVKGTALEKNQIKQKLLEDLLKKQGIQQDKRASNTLKKELQELKVEEKVLQEKNFYTEDVAKVYVYDQALKTAGDAAMQKDLAVSNTMRYADDTVQNTIIRFFNRRFRYPVEMMDHGGEGSIWYSVSLDETGKLKDYEIFQEEPAAAHGNVQGIVIVGYVHKDRVLGAPLSEERIRELMNAEVKNLSSKSVNIFGSRKVSPARYFYKATFKLEKGK